VLIRSSRRASRAGDARRLGRSRLVDGDRLRLGVGLVVLLAVIGTAMMARRGRYLTDSDSVAQQSVIQTWQHLGHDDAYLPQDTWLLKFPVYAVVEALPLSSSTRVLIETTILNGLGYLLVAVAWLDHRGSVQVSAST
jgi:hypothetical protein